VDRNLTALGLSLLVVTGCASPKPAGPAAPAPLLYEVPLLQATGSLARDLGDFATPDVPAAIPGAGEELLERCAAGEEGRSLFDTAWAAVEVGPGTIRVSGEQVLALDGWEPQPSNTRGSLLDPLFDRIRSLAEGHRRAEPCWSPFEGRALLLVHPETPHPLLVRTLYTLGMAGYRDLYLAVDDAGTLRSPPEWPAGPAFPNCTAFCGSARSTPQPACLLPLVPPPCRDRVLIEVDDGEVGGSVVLGPHRSVVERSPPPFRSRSSPEGIELDELATRLDRALPVEGGDPPVVVLQLLLERPLEDLVRLHEVTEPLHRGAGPLLRGCCGPVEGSDPPRSSAEGAGGALDPDRPIAVQRLRFGDPPVRACVAPDGTGYSVLGGRVHHELARAEPRAWTFPHEAIWTGEVAAVRHVRGHLRHISQRARVCYQLRLARRPDLAGELQLSVRVRADGRLEDLELRGDVLEEDERLRGCLQQIERIDIPGPLPGPVGMRGLPIELVVE